MTDLYIDADETQIYGQHAVRKIRVRVALLIPAFTEGMNYLATQLETATATVKHALETGRKAESGIRKGSRAKKPVKKRAVSLLGRFGKHLDAHERGAVDRKDYFVYDGTATGVGTGADNVLQAVVHCIANNVHQWIPDVLNDGFVQFRIFAFKYQLHLLFCVSGEVANQTRNFAEDFANRQHAGFHDRFLKLTGNIPNERLGEHERFC